MIEKFIEIVEVLEEFEDLLGCFEFFLEVVLVEFADVIIQFIQFSIHFFRFLKLSYHKLTPSPSTLSPPLIYPFNLTIKQINYHVLKTRHPKFPL